MPIALRPYKQRSSVKEIICSPNKFFHALVYIILIYEEHYNHHEYDARWLSLLKLLGLLPKLFFQQVFITTGVDALFCFISEKLSRGYKYQLKMLFKLLNLRTSRVSNSCEACFL